MVMKLAINGSYKLRTELDIVYEQGLAQYVTQACLAIEHNVLRMMR